MENIRKIFTENMQQCEEMYRKNDPQMIDNLMEPLKGLSAEQKLSILMTAYTNIYEKFRDSLHALASLHAIIEQYRGRFGDIINFNECNNPSNQKPEAPKNKKKRNTKMSYQKLKQRDEPKIKPKQLGEVAKPKNVENPDLNKESTSENKKKEKLVGKNRVQEESDKKKNIYADINKKMEDVTIEIIEPLDPNGPTMAELIEALSKNEQLADAAPKADRDYREPCSSSSSSHAGENNAATGAIKKCLNESKKKKKEKKEKKPEKKETHQYEVIRVDNVNQINVNQNVEDPKKECACDKKKPLTSKERYVLRKGLFTPTSKFH